MDNYFGFHRAKVIDNKDTELFGRVLVWIPDIMPEIPETEGIWARPANNPVGGRNSNNTKGGTSLIPWINSWVWVFFEGGNINVPYYFGSLDLESVDSKVLPEIRTGEAYEKWVVFKSPKGRTIVISDDPSDARIEITGSKSTDSDVFSIEGNQSVILINEGEGGSQILIKTKKGDFLNLDIDSRSFHAMFDGEIILESNSSVKIKSGGDLNILAGGDLNMKSTGNISSDASGNFSGKGGGNVILYGSSVMLNQSAPAPVTDTSGSANGGRK